MNNIQNKIDGSNLTSTIENAVEKLNLKGVSVEAKCGKNHEGIDGFVFAFPLKAAKENNQNPRTLAANVVKMCQDIDSDLNMSVSGPGFIFAPSVVYSTPPM